jgi:hypothetical protein
VTYFVLLDNGQRFGPADVRLLNQWAQEGRLLPGSTLEDTSTRQRFFANQMPGLIFPQGAPGMAPGQWTQPPGPMPYAQYQRPLGMADNGSGDLTASWVCSALSWVALPIVLSAVGLVMANKAEAKGNPSAQAARIFAMVSLALQIFGTCCAFGPLLFSAFL